RRSSRASCSALFSFVTGRWTNGTPYDSTRPWKSVWLETTAGISIGSAPMLCRNSRSLRQCPNLDTMIRVGIRIAASWICQDMWNAAAVAVKPPVSEIRSTPGSCARKCTRMKNSLVSGSPYCWLSTMVQPVTSRKLDTACTIPRWSGQESVSTYSRGAAGGVVMPPSSPIPICIAQSAARGYRRAVASSSYLRYPHLSGDLVTFVAEDDIWLASLTEATGGGATGGRAWRLTADQVPVLNPRLNPSGTRVAWTSTREASASLARGAAREVYSVPVDGGPVERLTYWGDGRIAVRGWLSDDEVLVISNAGQHDTMRTRAFGVPLAGTARLLRYGPASDVSIAPNGAVLLGSPTYTEPARWKRYGGGTGGKIWYSPDGTEYRQILAEVGNHLVNPMWVGDRVAFLSDHEGIGALYSALPDGSGLRRHTDLDTYYARHATTDGSRIVYQRAGDLWLLDSLDSDPVRLDVRLGGVRSGRA